MLLVMALGAGTPLFCVICMIAWMEYRDYGPWRGLVAFFAGLYLGACMLAVMMLPFVLVSTAIVRD